MGHPHTKKREKKEKKKKKKRKKKGGGWGQMEMLHQSVIRP
jgi:hypothetical protein